MIPSHKPKEMGKAESTTTELNDFYLSFVSFEGVILLFKGTSQRLSYFKADYHMSDPQ